MQTAAACCCLENTRSLAPLWSGTFSSIEWKREEDAQCCGCQKSSSQSQLVLTFSPTLPSQPLSSGRVPESTQDTPYLYTQLPLRVLFALDSTVQVVCCMRLTP